MTVAASPDFTGAKPAPAVFVPHGAGPFPILVAMGDAGTHPKFSRGPAQHASLIRTLRQWGQEHAKPKAALVISAHYQEGVLSITGTNPAPPMHYDYYGFPSAAYELKYSAPGASELAHRIAELLSQAGIKSRQDAERDFDHGVFVPLSFVWPDHDVPLAMLSLDASNDPEVHLRIGEALAPLRHEGVAIVGSGMTFHNMRAFRAGGSSLAAAAEAFDGYLQETMTSSALDAAARRQRLAKALSAPGAIECQPPGQTEHLLPLLVVAGAAGYQPARSIFSEQLLGFKTSGWEFS